MKLPIDTSGITFLVAVEPAPLSEHNSDRQRVDTGGKPIFVVRLLGKSGNDSEIFVVRVAGAPPKGLSFGMPVRCAGLSASPWTMGDRTGITYWADAIEPLSPTRQAT